MSKHPCEAVIFRLLDHTVCPRQHCVRNRNAKRFRCVEVDRQLDLRRLLDRQVSRVNPGQYRTTTARQGSRVDFERMLSSQCMHVLWRSRPVVGGGFVELQSPDDHRSSTHQRGTK